MEREPRGKTTDSSAITTRADKLAEIEIDGVADERISASLIATTTSAGACARNSIVRSLIGNRD